MTAPADDIAPVARALWAGALAGLATGLGDTLLVWGRIGQFLHGPGGKLACALHAASLYAAVGALGAAVLAAGVRVLARATALGPLWAHALAEHEKARARDPREAVVGLSLVLAGAPALAAALLAAHRIGVATLARRHHHGLIVLVVMGLTLALVIQAFINASVVLGLLPTKGIPLPFISAGGTSLVLSLFSVGLILNVSQHAD
jgi:hypothetical protein